MIFGNFFLVLVLLSQVAISFSGSHTSIYARKLYEGLLDVPHPPDWDIRLKKVGIVDKSIFLADKTIQGIKGGNYPVDLWFAFRCNRTSWEGKFMMRRWIIKSEMQAFLPLPGKRNEVTRFLRGKNTLVAKSVLKTDNDAFCGTDKIFVIASGDKKIYLYEIVSKREMIKNKLKAVMIVGISGAIMFFGNKNRK